MSAFKVGDKVVWRRSASSWSRIWSEDVGGIVIAVHPHRVRIKLMNGIKGRLSALVDPARLRKG